MIKMRNLDYFQKNHELECKLTLISLNCFTELVFKQKLISQNVQI